VLTAMADDEAQINAALNIMRRMPPSHVENSLAGLIELAPQLTDDLLTHVDQPLKLMKDPKTGKEFVLCDYNRDGDSHRSLWSNEYFPALDGFLPAQRLRTLEIEANNIFDHYRKMYFDTGSTSSVYLFNTDEKDDDSFGACFLIHKDVGAQKGMTNGVWDSIHVFQVEQSQKKNTFEYKLTTTVMVSMVVNNDKVGSVDLSGSMTQQSGVVSVTLDEEHGHVANMGRMVEDMELKIRNIIEGIYIQKTREIINGMRSVGAEREENFKLVAPSLQQAIAKHAASRKKDSD